MKILLVLAFLFAAATAATLPDLITGNHIQNGINEDIQRSLMMRAAVPSYAKDFLNLLKDTDPEKLPAILKRLLEGVETKACMGHTLEWIWRMMNITEVIGQGEREAWSIQMIDAWGKLPEGVLTGHINLYGDFHECVGIKARELDLLNGFITEDVPQEFEGQYCTSYLFDYGTAMSVVGRMAEQSRGIGVNEAVSLPELIKTILTQHPSMTMMLPTMGVCMPSTCSQMDIQNILVNIFDMTYSQIEGPELSPKMLPWPVTAACYVEKKKDFDAPVIIVITLLTILLALGIGAGAYDYWLSRQEACGAPDSVLIRYFLAFSMYTNTKKWLSTRKSADDLGCLHGIRFLSTAWVVLAHSYFAFISQPQWNMIDIKNIWKDWTVLAVINGTFSVDTFFVMSGMLATYNIMKLLDKTKGKFNVIMFYIHRYIRLTPTYAILVAIAATLLSYAGNGPFWASIDTAERNCRNNWWINILYINNLYRTDTMCNGESWYLANDMQFYILSPLIVYPLWKKEMIGMILLTVYTILSCIAPVLVSEYSPAPAAMVITANVTGNVVEIYMRPWSRIQTFIVGIWLGWILHKTKGKRMNLSPLVVTFGWLMSTGLALAVLFGIYPWWNPANSIPKVGGYFYAGLSRFTWGVAVSWVVFACVKGYGGLVNSFLSWKVFMPLGRLSFCVYLTSLHLQDIFHSRIAQPIRYDRYNMVNFFFAHMVMSCMVGFLCTLLFESPFIVLHKLIFEGSPKPKPKPVFINGAFEKDWKDENKNYPNGRA